MARLQERVSKKFGAEPPPTAKPDPKPKTQARAVAPKESVDPFETPAAPKAPETPADPEKAEPPAKEAPVEPGKEPVTPAEPSQADLKNPKSPWRMVDQLKKQVKALENQVVEARSTSLPAQEKHDLTTRLQEREARLKELEDEIRFVNYRKSTEFQEKYQKPYEDRWQVAMSEIGEMTVSHPETGETRMATSDDLMRLVHMPLVQARDMAEQMFGKFANDVMNYRKEIKSLLTEQAKALNDFKSKGPQWEQERNEAQKKKLTDIHGSVVETAQKVHARMLADESIGSFLQPVEGDDEVNGRLQKGYELVDEWFLKNPVDDKLSEEERSEIVRHQVAIRNRAAAFGAAIHQLKGAKQKISALEKELGQYRESTPQAGGAPKRSGAAQPQPVKAWDRMVAKLQERAI